MGTSAASLIPRLSVISQPIPQWIAAMCGIVIPAVGNVANIRLTRLRNRDGLHNEPVMPPGRKRFVARPYCNPNTSRQRSEPDVHGLKQGSATARMMTRQIGPSIWCANDGPLQNLLVSFHGTRQTCNTEYLNPRKQRNRNSISSVRLYTPLHGLVAVSVAFDEIVQSLAAAGVLALTESNQLCRQGHKRI